jgi:hypothetical protein
MPMNATQMHLMQSSNLADQKINLKITGKGLSGKQMMREEVTIKREYMIGMRKSSSVGIGISISDLTLPCL